MGSPSWEAKIAQVYVLTCVTEEVNYEATTLTHSKGFHSLHPDGADLSARATVSRRSPHCSIVSRRTVSKRNTRDCCVCNQDELTTCWIELVGANGKESHRASRPAGTRLNTLTRERDAWAFSVLMDGSVRILLPLLPASAVVWQSQGCDASFSSLLCHTFFSSRSWKLANLQCSIAAWQLRGKLISIPRLSPNVFALLANFLHCEIFAHQHQRDELSIFINARLLEQFS